MKFSKVLSTIFVAGSLFFTGCVLEAHPGYPQQYYEVTPGIDIYLPFAPTCCFVYREGRWVNHPYHWHRSHNNWKRNHYHRDRPHYDNHNNKREGDREKSWR